ncbi:hypothetical protein AW27_034210 (plasmid) [Streptomyces sp. PCS3-D2]|uniref:hypothetical protein n=1 Tax=Streptomyces sp. PCS3-D2 TaxID=1460244 RepID=UPI000AB9E583|nr:hypothetical protein [Streptomyces sp. PCS3-D2]WKV76621.1 hypothetical protein AW27_034210 [Streptomyces sp. PCS3-D2]
MSDAERQAAAAAMEQARQANTLAIWNATVAAEELAATVQAADAVAAQAAQHLAR